ncbi:hypothetical protein LPU83_pLPU83d_0493 (plasmid) [Rhizobium favelukesii]|uniref:Uncharacterized protein n=1 Tax=Rhizobium favelukesii TaxID=348824 RepID=W6RM59_9HYPH|nr:hypothetical protein LPU83_pLPU83d_0493 [Rhizobium favelukesii]
MCFLLFTAGRRADSTMDDRHFPPAVTRASDLACAHPFLSAYRIHWNVVRLWIDVLGPAAAVADTDDVGALHIAATQTGISS